MKKLDDLCFMVIGPTLSYSNEGERRELTVYNIFSHPRVRESVARWIVMDETERKQHDFLPWCFFDYRGRAQYEFIVCPWPYGEEDTIANSGQKVDIYQMYISPNEHLLRAMVEEVSVTSARAFLVEVNKRRQAERKRLKELRNEQKKQNRMDDGRASNED